MEATSSDGAGIHENCLDVSFGFDDPKYSDRTLLLQIENDDTSNSERNSKRRRPDDLHLTAIEAPRAREVHINSLILAARSAFFHKLFSNGMLESEQKSVTLRIDTSEEASLMHLLKYMYSNNLPTTLNALLDLSVIADKFKVESCLRDCIRSLQNFPMTYESASLYLDLPPGLQMSPLLQPLTAAAKQFLVANFKYLHWFQEEMLNLPLTGIQVVLSSDDLKATSEDVVYDFVLEWAHRHYPNLEERRGILKTYLLHLIRFPLMTTKKLIEQVQTCKVIDPEVASKIVIRALGFKAETPYRKRCIAAEDGNAASRQFVERAYNLRPIKVVELALPQPQCIVYFSFSRESLITDWESFHLGEHELVFCGRRDGLENFSLALKAVGSGDFTVNYDIQLRMNPPGEFKSWVKGSLEFRYGSYMLYNQKSGPCAALRIFHEPQRTKDLKHVPLTEFIRDNSPYLINDVVHVRAELIIEE